MTTMLRACAYCDAPLPPREVPDGDPAAGLTSHGICDQCADDGRHMRVPEREPWALPIQVTYPEWGVITLALLRAARVCDEYAAEPGREVDERQSYLADAADARALYAAIHRRDAGRRARLLADACAPLSPPADPLASNGDQADALRALVVSTLGGRRE